MLQVMSPCQPSAKYKSITCSRWGQWWHDHLLAVMDSYQLLAHNRAPEKARCEGISSSTQSDGDCDGLDSHWHICKASIKSLKCWLRWALDIHQPLRVINVIIIIIVSAAREIDDHIRDNVIKSHWYACQLDMKPILRCTLTCLNVWCNGVFW
jgi:hypothetical protein